MKSCDSSPKSCFDSRLGLEEVSRSLFPQFAIEAFGSVESRHVVARRFITDATLRQPKAGSEPHTKPHTTVENKTAETEDAPELT
jgi:hypothetical protein